MPLLDPAIGYLILTSGALLFASASIHKLRDLSRFTAIFGAYRILPEPLGRRVTGLIPLTELGVAITLLWPPAGRPAAVVPAIVVLVVYAGGMGINIARGKRDLDCGCAMGQGRRPIATWMVCRNLCLAAALGIAGLPWSSRPLNGIDLVTVAGGLIVGATLYAAVDRLLGDVMPRTLIMRSTS
jgi:hypothetical protein